ncbi:MAG: hypothetical protein RJB42_1585 [Bacteroidota bacterium]|jgi:hypothetical protein
MLNAMTYSWAFSYNNDTLDFDYALLVFERATTQDIKLIMLNSDENFPAPDSVARIMGWGQTTTEPSSGGNVCFGSRCERNQQC